MRSMIFGAVVFLSVSRLAAAQDSLEVLSADRETSAQLTRILVSARERGLPTEPIVAKARQGVLLRSTPSRIVVAVEAVSRRLEAARAALDPHATPSDIRAGEDALAIDGVTSDMLKRVRSARPNRPVAVPIGVMGQLVASGVSPRHATEIIMRLVKGGAKDEQLAALGNDVNDDVRQGRTALGSLEVRLISLRPFLAPMGNGGAATATLSAPGVSGAGGGSGKPRNP